MDGKVRYLLEMMQIDRFIAVTNRQFCGGVQDPRYFAGESLAGSEDVLHDLASRKIRRAGAKAMRFVGCCRRSNAYYRYVVHLLPPHIRIWVGGSSPALRRKVRDGVLHVPGLTSIVEAVEEWRQSAVR
ncbi:hypothetical protein CBA19CS11_37850 [Caballeronia novacaledonica]|uniref:hypothetical protein n=1 Tax=Caballeronia novacaledonica TaxID=1544861 RepID=UPI001EE31D1B|nr:hypothetical protein [Caballeronia novacaledonica]GJH14730.1 hypothetical protein CBA19CS11_37850 [Caballeronia novacaledonica]